MNWFRKWMLKRIIRDVVKQGGHKENIVQFYGLLIEGFDKEFTEDNNTTLDYFLTDCHTEAMERYLEW